jgi:hypothetical protein
MVLYLEWRVTFEKLPWRLAPITAAITAMPAVTTKGYELPLGTVAVLYKY